MSGQSSVTTCAPYDVSDVLRALLPRVHVHYMYWAHYVTILCLSYPYSIPEFYFSSSRTARHLFVALCSS